MEIQTILAQRLVEGRARTSNASGIIGLKEFGRRMQALWEAAEQDDPYADWYLSTIEAAIESAKVAIDTRRQRIQEILNGMEAFTIDIAQTIEPIRVPLQFANPYGYMGAYLVADYDVLCRATLTARHLGLIDRVHSEEILQASGKALRRIFAQVAQWRFTGVRRADLLQNNRQSERARSLMGDVPDEFLFLRKRAKKAPAIHANLAANPQKRDRTLPSVIPTEKDMT